MCAATAIAESGARYDLTVIRLLFCRFNFARLFLQLLARALFGLFRLALFGIELLDLLDSSRYLRSFATLGFAAAIHVHFSNTLRQLIGKPHPSQHRDARSSFC